METRWEEHLFPQIWGKLMLSIGSIVGWVSLPSCCYSIIVDDTTITEIIRDRKTPSVMDDSVQYLVSWSKTNKMLINHTKTKEMILGNAKADQIPPLFIEGERSRA